MKLIAAPCPRTMAQPSQVSLYERAVDVLEKLDLARTVMWHALPGGKFAFGTQVGATTDLSVRCFIACPPQTQLCVCVCVCACAPPPIMRYRRVSRRDRHRCGHARTRRARAHSLVGARWWRSALTADRLGWVRARTFTHDARLVTRSQTVRGVPMRAWTNLPNLDAYLRPFFKQHAKKDWISYEGETYTFGQARRMADAVSLELRQAFGVQPGDRVGLAMRNHPEFLIGFIAIIAAGGVAVPLNALWETKELEYAVSDSACKVLFVDEARLQRCAPFLATLNGGVATILVRSEAGSPAASATWAGVLQAAAARGGKDVRHRVRAAAEDEAMIMYTSGSTGFPKGVCHTHRSVGTAVKIGEVLAVARPEPEGKALLAVPLFHVTALLPIFLFSIPAGTQVVMMYVSLARSLLHPPAPPPHVRAETTSLAAKKTGPGRCGPTFDCARGGPFVSLAVRRRYKWDAGHALSIIEDQRITRFTGVPTMIKDMMEHPTFSPHKVRSMKSMLAGGAPVPPTQLASMRSKAKKVQAQQGYGLTETMGMGTGLSVCCVAALLRCRIGAADGPRLQRAAASYKCSPHAAATRARGAAPCAHSPGNKHREYASHCHGHLHGHPAPPFPSPPRPAPPRPAPPAGAANRGTDYLTHPTSCGKPVPLIVEMVIKDPATGKTLKNGQRGEVCIKGPIVMKYAQSCLRTLSCEAREHSVKGARR